MVAATIPDYGLGSFNLLMFAINPDGALIFVKTMSITDNTFIQNIKEASNGGTIIAALRESSPKAIMAILLDSDGNEVWTKQYITPADDNIRDIIELASGEFVLAGYSKTLISETFEKAFLIKINSSGIDTANFYFV